MKRIFFIFSLFLTTTLFAETGTVVFIKGTVTNLKGKKISKNHIVKIGDTIKTGKGSLAVVKLPEGNKVKIGAESTLKFNKLPKSKKETTILSLFKGNSFFKVLKGKLRKGQKSKLTLRTRTAAMGVRGTEFFASYGSGKDVWMCVNEGIVAVRSIKEKKPVLVKQGEGVVVTKEEGTSEPKPLAWTKKLNWNMDPTSGEVENKVPIESAYSDLLDEDYD